METETLDETKSLQEIEKIKKERKKERKKSRENKNDKKSFETNLLSKKS